MLFIMAIFCYTVVIKKKKNYNVTCSHFPLGKIDADALLKLSTDSMKTGYIPLVPLLCVNRH